MLLKESLRTNFIQENWRTEFLRAMSANPSFSEFAVRWLETGCFDSHCVCHWISRQGELEPESWVNVAKSCLVFSHTHFLHGKHQSLAWNMTFYIFLQMIFTQSVQNTTHWRKLARKTAKIWIAASIWPCDHHWTLRNSQCRTPGHAAGTIYKWYIYNLK